ncbi:MAG: endonuclease/exonuclease/phosphatase family protein [Saprospiraceae bacterium]|nr:endonuclease/exonuclease/phosphatase family protein [Saprospiraceae bacterium]
MKVLSWNIRQGGGRRVAGICHYLRSTAAHIIVLSEYRNNDAGLVIRKRMLESGYLHQVTHDERTGKNGVCIFSRLPFEATRYAGLDHGHGLLLLDLGPIRIFGAYLPHKKKHSLFKPIYDRVTKDEHLVLVGDLNTGVNFIDQRGDSFWYTEDLRLLREAGMADAYRHLHGSVKEFSWFSHGGNGYRYDHSYVSEALLPIVDECYYDHAPRESGLSDHAPMILVLGSTRPNAEV